MTEETIPPMQQPIPQPVLPSNLPPANLPGANLPGANLPTASLPPGRLSALRSIAALTLREMSSTYGRNPGGYLWAILEPVGVIAILALAFSLIMRAPPIGNSFILFFATGFLAFDLFSSTQGKVQSALRVAKPLLSYPRVNWLDAILARVFLNTLTETTVMIIIWSAIVAVANTHTILDIRPVLHGLAIVVLTGVGVGLVNGLLIGLFPIWSSLWGVISRPLLLASGVLIMYEQVPPFVQDILWWNPLMHATSLVRAGFYSTYHPNFVSLPYCYGLALVLILLGLIWTRAWYKVVLEQ